MPKTALLLLNSNDLFRLDVIHSASHQPQHDKETSVLAAEENEIAEPQMYHVILLNDDYTPMDFVIELLMVVFRKDFEQAKEIMLAVHYKDRAVAGTYTHEIAVEKMHEANEVASANGFPLHTIIEAA